MIRDITYRLWTASRSDWMMVNVTVVENGDGDISVKVDGTNRNLDFGGPWQKDFEIRDTKILVSPGPHSIEFATDGKRSLVISVEVSPGSY